MRRGILVAFALALAAPLAWSSNARAYCRSTTGCDPTGGAEGQTCAPSASGDCGTPLFWAQPCVGFNVQKDASVQIAFADADATLQQAFTSWLDADCGGGTGPAIQIADLGPMKCNKNEYNEHGGNANALIFHDDAWPHEDVLDGNQDIALTTVTYDTNTGEIFDADIEVNAHGYALTLSDDNVQYDLLSILTHEVGHFFGLAHAQQPQFADATMQPSYATGSTDLRTLDPDDIAAICAVYPVGRPTKGECDYLPRHGFASECLADQDEGTCAYSPGKTDTRSRGPALLVTAVLGLALAARRRRARAR